MNPLFRRVKLHTVKFFVYVMIIILIRGHSVPVNSIRCRPDL